MSTESHVAAGQQKCQQDAQQSFCATHIWECFQIKYHQSAKAQYHVAVMVYDNRKRLIDHKQSNLNSQHFNMLIHIS